MSNATFTAPDLDAFCQLDRLGLTVTGQRIEPHRSVLECRVLEPDNWRRNCGQQGVYRGTVIRRLAHIPLGWRPTMLQVRVRRYRCPDYRSAWRQDTSTAAAPPAVLSRHAALWALKGVVIDRLSVARIAAGLAVAWSTANDAILESGQQLLINDPTRFDGVRVIGVDEHVWSHTRRGSNYVTIIIDLTPIRDGTGASRLLDMVPGRSKKAFKSWLDGQTAQFRNGVEVVAMDGFTGFKSATVEELPEATAVMDPLPCRLPGRREGRSVPPAYSAGRPRPPGSVRGSALRDPARSAHRC